MVLFFLHEEELGVKSKPLTFEFHHKSERKQLQLGSLSEMENGVASSHF